MPLPRFTRLAPDEKARILSVARGAIAAHGFERVSLNAIAAQAGLSRSAFYNYFDGKQDLFSAVNHETLERLTRTIGAWEKAERGDSFWSAFASTHQRIIDFLTDNPDDRALLANLAPSPELEGWIHDAFENALALGLVDTAPGRSLLQAATVSVIAAADSAELEEPGSVSTDVLRTVLERLWSQRS